MSQQHIINNRGEPDDFDCQWKILESALKQIHAKNASNLSFEQLYRASYKAVLKKYGDSLYVKVKGFEEEWFSSHVMPKIATLITTSLISASLGNAPGSTTNERRVTGENFLKGLKDAYEDHVLCMNMTTDVLMYMDKSYCTDNHRPSILTTSMGLFRDHVIKSQLSSEYLTTFDIITSVLLDQIHMEREGDVIDKNLIRSIIYMLEWLYETDEEKDAEKLYLTVFEPEFLQASKLFYQNECQVLLRDSDASTWLRRTQKRLTEEADRCRTTISILTDEKISKVIEQEMIVSHLQEFISMEGSGIKAMIDNDRFEDLSLLYQNISRVDKNKEALKDAISSRVVTLGSDINEAITNTNFGAVPPSEGGSGEKGKVMVPNAAAQQTLAAIKWVEDVLTLKDKFDNIWKRCFNEDIAIQTALTKSFSDFINQYPRSSEYVSLFIDENLKRGIKGKTEAEVDVVLDKATLLLRYVTDKDMFERYYKKHLARRLLHGKSESTDVEKQMISRMKQEIGNYFTNKLEGMFKDMTMSEELTSNYRNYISNLGDRDSHTIDLGVNVLTSNYWPMDAMGGGPARDGTPRVQCQWPPEIKRLQDSFKEFYLKERNGRQLSWLGFTGSADIKCTFPAIAGKDGLLGRVRRHELNVPTYGMVILLLFNNLAPGETLSFEAIQEETLIPASELSRILTTLAVLPKAKVLNKSPATKQVKPGDLFSFNDAFTCKAVKIKAPTITGVNKVEGEEERKDTENRNDESRGVMIEACLVRIMKSVFSFFVSHPSQYIERKFTNIEIDNAKSSHINSFSPNASLSLQVVSDLTSPWSRSE